MTGRQGASRSIHFPAASEPPARPSEQTKVLDCFAGSLRDVEQIREKLRALLVSENRHGDLQAALSATRRLESSLLELIRTEEA